MLSCTKCQQLKLPEEMSKDKGRRNGLSSWCKDCRKISTRNWGVKHPERKDAQNSYKKETYRENPPDYLKSRGWMLKHRYGISLSDFENILKQQDNSCAICKRSAEDTTYHFHVDHCHATGKVRGLLCAPCNVYLGYTKDNAVVYANALNYLGE